MEDRIASWLAQPKRIRRVRGIFPVYRYQFYHRYFLVPPKDCIRR
jgi:hypothetical protein